MNLVEAEAVGPVEGDAPLFTAPRPPHRRVSVSLLFTLTVLIGTVVAIYTVFPARDNVLLSLGVERHAEGQPRWDLTAPAPAELRAWVLGVVGGEPPLPPAAATVLGGRRLEVLRRPVALMALQLGPDRLTYLVQHPHGLPPRRAERTDGAVHAITYQRGTFTCVVVGPAATRATWRAAFE